MQPLNVAVGRGIHCAYKMVFDARLHVEDEPAPNVVPVPSAAVFHPANEYPVRTNDPLFADAVNDASNVALADDGTTPPVDPFPSYDTV